MQSKRPVKLFISYSHLDEHFKDKLIRFIEPLKSKGLLSYWEASKLLIGTEFTADILAALDSAELFLLLLSPDAVASQYIRSIELARAFERYEMGTLVIVPVIVKPCDWGSLNLKHFHATPVGGRPITTWENEDEALATVIEQVEKLAISILQQRQGEKEKTNLNNAKEYEARKRGSQTVHFHQKVRADTIFNNVEKITIESKSKKK